MTHGYIYMTTCKINGMKYIGKRTNSDPETDTKYRGSSKRLLEDIKLLGIENFERVTLELCQTNEEDLIELEKKWIREFDAVKDPMFYNLTYGGNGFVPGPRSEETRARLRGEKDESSKKTMSSTWSDLMNSERGEAIKEKRKRTLELRKAEGVYANRKNKPWRVKEKSPVAL
ncbi:hypothetical protein P9VFCI_162 [Rhizobium phage P9VFCI]|uniref:Homing endonuclease n=2 Tax=Innesvirus TaxID=3044739 RepID=A0A076YIS9_9CAUD|nr:NAD synthetase [Rhizobium phage vB_RleM_P10VF]YP_010662055.1 homing endonuclease [Rhizobium phage P9VFCI]AIK68343.1 homing endonuclease [Rhizobium phage vB_RleM_P10VF]QNH71860.1 hypothetical protein P9VFCI_162 [Rhizobium phage P9VFCI]